jgi:hypothetical protein
MSCGASHDQIYKYEEKPATIPCESEGCDGVGEYVVGRPAMYRIKFDNGGRVGFKIDSGDGKTQYRSATRERYEHNIGNRSAADLKKMTSDEKSGSVYTREYDRHVKQKEKATLDKANTELKQILKGQK